MGYKANDPCLEKAFDDERLFVLMTRDNSAPELVIEWIKQNLHNQPKEKLLEAFNCALEMADRCYEMNMRKKGWFKCDPDFNSMPVPGTHLIVLFHDDSESRIYFDGIWPEQAAFYKTLNIDNEDLPF
jgi:hypothetical protein